MKVVIVGFGLIGRERYNALRELQHAGFPINEIRVYDPFIRNEDKYNSGIIWLESLKEVEESNPDWVIICTPHNINSKLVKEILPWGCNILMEKPFGMNLKDAQDIYNLKIRDNQLFIGYNYRFYEGVQALKKDLKNNLFGEIININVELGHGGSTLDRNTWKVDPNLNGRGALIEPGSHCIDLLYYLGFNPKPICGKKWSGFWNTGIDEEVHLILEEDKIIIDFKISLVKWRSVFKFEIYGTDGYGLINGKGRSYGNQTYVCGKRWGWTDGKTQKESEEIVVESDCKDSFYLELKSLLQENNLDACNSNNALKNMVLIEECYNIFK